MDITNEPETTSLLTAFPQGTRVLVVGGQGGIGSALLNLLNHDPRVGEIHLWSRRAPEDNPAMVKHALVDITQEDSIASAAKSIEGIDLVLVATGKLHSHDSKAPEKSLKDISTDNFIDNLLVNTVGPTLIAKHIMAKLPRDGRAVFGSLSARVGSIEDNRLGGWYSYRASKAALNQVLKTISIELARTRPKAICVGLHPGTVDTQLSRPFQKNVPPGSLFTPTFSAGSLLTVVNELTVTDTGGLFAFDGERIPF